MMNYVKGMMVEITEGSFAGRWGKLIVKTYCGTWLVKVHGFESMEFLENEFKPSGFHDSLNKRILANPSEIIG